MIPHEKPVTDFVPDLDTELKALEKLRTRRKIPNRTNSNVLIATWNMTNFGIQERQDVHLQIMADIINPFDVIAIQEIADDLGHLKKLLRFLGDKWDVTYSDPAGNKERLAYLFRTDRVERTGLTAELAMRGYERKRITVQISDNEPEEEPFEGFNRNPYMVNFLADKFEFTIVNVHLYYSNMVWRRLEAKALAKWAKSRVKKADPPNDDILLIGDFNMEKVDVEDKIKKELDKAGLVIPNYGTQLVGTNLAGDYYYDQLLFFPKKTKSNFTGEKGVFDFDKELFAKLWDDSDRLKRELFYQYIRFYIADHRLLWAEFSRQVA